MFLSRLRQSAGCTSLCSVLGGWHALCGRSLSVGYNQGREWSDEEWKEKENSSVAFLTRSNLLQLMCKHVGLFRKALFLLHPLLDAKKTDKNDDVV